MAAAGSSSPLPPAGGNDDDSSSGDDHDFLVPGIPRPPTAAGSGGAPRASAKVFLLYGPSGAGKTMYCRQFLAEGMARGDRCMYLDTSAQAGAREAAALFFGLSTSPGGSIQVLSLHDLLDGGSIREISGGGGGVGRRGAAATAPERIIAGLRRQVASAPGGAEQHGSRPLRLAVDSLTPLLLLMGKRGVMRFTAELSSLLKEERQAFAASSSSTAILTIASMDRDLVSVLGSLVDGTLEMKIEEQEGSEGEQQGGGFSPPGARKRSIRLSSLKGAYHRPSWVSFEIAEDGSVAFSPGSASSASAGTGAGLTCTLCGKPVGRTPVVESDFVFDTKKCADTYRKFYDAYGSSMPETGLPSKVVDIGFFFVDIVGLSDPRLSVKSQVQKIEALNRLIGECEAFKRTPAGKKLVLPAGDGMAIGFLLNPELPLELAIQLHRKLAQYNRDRRSQEDRVQVRIGLGSGPIFTVSDLTDAQNVWGPGIILARRVMDAGDEGHILLAGNMAEDLIALKDEYRSFIRLISDSYEIKHGQKIRLYSAHSADFGNPRLPSRVKS